MRYAGMYLGTIGPHWPPPGPEMYRVRSAIGRILPADHGKQVYAIGDVVQVENNEQRDARLKVSTSSDS